MLGLLSLPVADQTPELIGTAGRLCVVCVCCDCPVTASSLTMESLWKGGLAWPSSLGPK